MCLVLAAIELPTYSSLELNLLRLGWLSKETKTIYKEYPSTNEKTFHLRSIVRYYLGIRLHDFIQIRKLLYKDLKDLKRTELDDCLKPLWQPIQKHEVAIAELRRSYLAHLQEKENFERHINEIIFERQYPSSHGDARYFAGCVWKYCDVVIFNFPREMEQVEKKYAANEPTPAFVHDIPTEVEAPVVLKKTIESVISNLKAKGLRTQRF